MAPPFHANDDAPSATQSIYTFPPPSSSSMSRPSSVIAGGANNGAADAATASATPTAGSRPPTVANPKPHYICSPIPSMTASFLLHRRLLLPTFVMPTLIVFIPPLVISILSLLASLATSSSHKASRASLPAILVTSLAVLLSTFLVSTCVFRSIERLAPSEFEKKKALARSTFAVPFWSLVLSIVGARTLDYLFGDFLPLASKGGATTSTLLLTVRVGGACFGPAMGWTILSLLVLSRYAGPFCPIVRCSSTPLQTNPFDATLQRLGRNFTSKNRFLDMIADGLDKLSAPSKSPAPATTSGNPFMVSKPTPAMNAKANAMNQQQTNNKNNEDGVGRLIKFLVSSSKARYSRPGLLSILVQVLVNATGGLVIALSIIPYLGNFGCSMINLDNTQDPAVVIVILSCSLGPVFELFSSINESELHYVHYSSFNQQFRIQPLLAAIMKDAMLRVKRSIWGVVLLAPIVASIAILLWSSFALSSPSYPAILQSIFLSFLAVGLLASIMAIQDMITRWSVCAPCMDVDVLMYQSPTSTPKNNDTSPTIFLAEDLFVQSILMGDGATVHNVIAPSGGKLLRHNYQEDEISRNEIATLSFSKWIQQSSTTSSGKLSDDILRMTLLESIGGGGSAYPTTLPKSNPFYFGHARHSKSIRKRLKFSAVNANPGQQQIIVPVVRALCAFSGGIGDAMSEIYRQLDKDGKPLYKNNSAELWKLPPGMLHALEFSTIAASRIVVMNSVMIDKNGCVVVNASRRHERLSLLLPCILQSAYKARCGLLEYAKATANMREVYLSTYDKSDKSDGLGRFIDDKCPELCSTIEACNGSAKMAMKALLNSGDHSFEELLQRKWKGGMRKWLGSI